MRRKTLPVLALVPTLALGLQACGGDGKTGATGTAKAASDQDRMRKFARCMRENGVDMKDPSGDGRIEIKASAKPGGKGMANGPQGIYQAQKKCRHLMPNGGKPRKPNPEELAQRRAFSKCMREHGITSFPDPDPDGGIKIEGARVPG